MSRLWNVDMHFARLPVSSPLLWIGSLRMENSRANRGAPKSTANFET